MRSISFIALPIVLFAFSTCFAAADLLPKAQCDASLGVEVAKLKKKVKVKRNIAMARTSSAVDTLIVKPLRDGITSIKVKPIELRSRAFGSYLRDREEGYVKYESNPSSNKMYQDKALRYYLAQLLVLRPLEGVLWRVRPMVDWKEKGDKYQGSRTIHSAIVTMIRSINLDMDILSPNREWQTGFDFYSIPAKSAAAEDRIQTVSEFQDFMVKELVPKLCQAAVRIRAIYESMNANEQLVWDQQALFGRSSFNGTNSNTAGRYLAHTVTEVNATLASIHTTIHNILVWSAYDQDKIFKVASALGKMHGISAINPFTDQGIKSVDEFNKIQSFMNSSKFLTLRNGGKKYMNRAYAHLQRVAGYTRMTAELAEITGLQIVGISANAVSTNFSGVTSAGAQELIRIATDDQVSFHDPLQGDVVSISFKNFYMNPPKNLNALMPTKFSGSRVSNKNGNFKVDIKTGKTKVRDFSVGQPIQWNNSAWKKYIPSAEGAPPSHVRTAFRVMKQNTVPSIFAGPLSFFIQ